MKILSSHGELCPVCKGTGKYYEYVDYSSVSYHNITTCHGCSGKGWITIKDTDENTTLNNVKNYTFDELYSHIPHID